MEYQRKIDEIIPFLSAYRTLIDSHVTAVYITDYFSSIPNDWFAYLDSFNCLDLLQISKNIDQVSYK